MLNPQQLSSQKACPTGRQRVRCMAVARHADIVLPACIKSEHGAGKTFRSITGSGLATCRCASLQPGTSCHYADRASVADRRQIVLAPLMGGLALACSGAVPQWAHAEEATAATVAGSGQLATLRDEILAYTFDYPVSTVSGNPLKMILSHEPEKYSSAAPLTADARQRIVCELLDLRQFVSMSVSVGPASGVLKESDPNTWKPYDVAFTVLVDRSTSRLTSGQRKSLNDVESASVETRDGGRYFAYEYISQGSPTLLEAGRKETYRHALAVTTVRPDANTGTQYLYTLNLSCRQEMWDDLEPLFKAAVASFRLLPPTSNFVSPDTNPWQFW